MIIFIYIENRHIIIYNSSNQDQSVPSYSNRIYTNYTISEVSLFPNAKFAKKSVPIIARFKSRLEYFPSYLL